MSEDVTISQEQLERFQESAAALASLQQSRDAEVAIAETRAMLARGELDAAAKQSESRIKQAEDRAKAFAATAELARVLSAERLVPHGAEHLQRLLADQVTAIPVGNTFQVRAKDGRPVADFVAQTLQQPTYSHFMRSASAAAGTITAPGVPQQSSGPALPFETPTNVGQAIVNDFVTKRNATPVNPHTILASTTNEDGKRVMAALPAFGLRPLGR